MTIPDTPGSSLSEPIASNESSQLDELVRVVAHAPPRTPPPEPLEGTRWGASARFVIERRLGRGGMGTVFVATDTLLGRQVALKVLDSGRSTDEALDRARVLREAGIAARVEHERVARVYDVGEHEGSPFIAMELVRGVTLRTWLASRQTSASTGVSSTEVLAILSEILEGLAALHASGVVHRDLKPENVMLSAGGVKLLDFGLAKTFVLPERPSVRVASAPAGDFPSVGPLSGTPGYMAPEQWEGGTVDQRADVFALGVILYELVTATRPFEGEGALEILEATVRDKPRFTEEAWARMPPHLCVIARKMLSRRPSDRYPDAASISLALGAAKDVASTRSLLPITTSRELGEAPTIAAVPGTSHSRVKLLSAAAIFVAAIAILAGSSLKRPRPPAQAVPDGMARIDEGVIRVGQTADTVKRQCEALGTRCNPQLMSWQEPELQVSVAPFFLDALEVTNRDLAEVLNTLRSTLSVALDDDGHERRFVRINAGLAAPDESFLLDLDPTLGGIEYTDGQSFRPRAGREMWPATQVTWFGARAYCAARGRRLPTEDEWEAAARGAANRAFPWGEPLPRCGEVVVPNDGFLPMDASCPLTPTPRDVGSAPQDVTPQGIHDLGGNLSEWMETPFAEGGRGQVSLLSLTGTSPRVLRGGSFFFSLLARTSTRNKRPANTAWVSVGFRCALDARD